MSQLLSQLPLHFMIYIPPTGYKRDKRFTSLDFWGGFTKLYHLQRFFPGMVDLCQLSWWEDDGKRISPAEMVAPGGIQMVVKIGVCRRCQGRDPTTEVTQCPSCQDVGFLLQLAA